MVLLVLLGAISSLIIVWCYFIIKKHKSSHHDAVSLRCDPQTYGSHGSFVSINGKEVDSNITNGNYHSSANVGEIYLHYDPV